MGSVRNGIPVELALKLRDISGIGKFIETGTNYGRTAAWAAAHFREVLTIEGHVGLRDAAAARHASLTNVRFVLGDSGVLLPEALRDSPGPAIFWLDAHYSGPETFGVKAECPVVAELAAINATTDDHVILIDDARFFLKPAPISHNADHWPEIVELVGVLSPPERPRYVIVTDDVIVAVPMRYRADLKAFLREPSEAPVSGWRGWFTRRR